MSVEAWTRTPVYTVAGIGPYAITHPYASDAIMVFVVVSGARVLLTSIERTITPGASEIEGNVFLPPAVAATHAGRQLIIDRATPDEQGWIATQGEREAGLAAQLDRMVQSTQENRQALAGALRSRENFDPFDWTDGTVPMRQGGRVVSGPTATEISNAQARASEAETFALAAAASAASAQARELSMLRDRGNWATSLLYSPSDIITINGSAYICIVSHFATVFATDLTGGKWRLFAAKGDAGAGTGDMLKTENLSGLTNVPQARTNLGLQALAIKALATFADLDPTAIITDVETLAANKVANAIPTAKAVADYVDGLLPKRQLIGSWDWSTNVAGVTLAGLAGWDNIQVYVENLAETATQLRVQVSFDNGSSILSAGYKGGCNDGVGASDHTDGLAISRASTTAALSGTFTLEGMATGPRCIMRGAMSALGSSRNPHSSSLAPAGIVNAIRIAGNTIASGVVRVFGLRRA